MFSRAAFSAARCARATPLKQAVRNYSSPAAEKKSSKIGLVAAVALVAAGAVLGYNSLNAGAAVKPTVPAIPALTGDGKWVDLKLLKREQLSPNTQRLRFELPSEDHTSGLKTASCLITKFKGPGDAKVVIRPYTPVTFDETRGHMDLVIKKYEGGKMSTHVFDLPIGENLAFKGPILKYEWTPNKHEHVALVAGGTGITPMYQIVKAIFNNPEDKTKVTLVLGNLTEDDILLRKELNELENTYPQRFKAIHVLDSAPKKAGWAVEGRITKELLKTHIPEPKSGNNKIFVCGPPGLYNAISGSKASPSDQGEIAGALKELGYTKEDVFKF